MRLKRGRGWKSGPGAREKGSRSEQQAKSKIMQQRRVGLRFSCQVQGFSVTAAAAGDLSEIYFHRRGSFSLDSHHHYYVYCQFYYYDHYDSYSILVVFRTIIIITSIISIIVVIALVMAIIIIAVVLVLVFIVLLASWMFRGTDPCSAFACIKFF